MSALVAIADAVAASLNAGSFGVPFVARRLYQPAFELAELAEPKVSVVPASVSIATASRDGAFCDCTVGVGVQQKLEAGQLEPQIDALLGLVERIADHLRMRRLDEYPQAAWLSIEHDPVVAAESLEQNRVFTSVLRVTYRVGR